MSIVETILNIFVGLGLVALGIVFVMVFISLGFL